MWVEFTDQMGRYEPGVRVDLNESIARRALRLDRARPVDGPRGAETAARRAPETAARRTRDPTRHGWEYRGNGWWAAPSGEKVRAPQDATLETLNAKLE